MTNPGYEELEAQARIMGRSIDLCDALADLRKQRDEAVARADVQSRNATNARRFVNEYHQENATLRAENERLTRERDDLRTDLKIARHETVEARQATERVLDDRQRQFHELDETRIERDIAKREAERLRKVAEGERERICREAQIEVVLPDFESDRGYRDMWKCLPPEWVDAIRALPPPALTPDARSSDTNLSSKED